MKFQNDEEKVLWKRIVEQELKDHTIAISVETADRIVLAYRERCEKNDS